VKIIEMRRIYWRNDILEIRYIDGELYLYGKRRVSKGRIGIMSKNDENGKSGVSLLSTQALSRA